MNLIFLDRLLGNGGYRRALALVKGPMG